MSQYQKSTIKGKKHQKCLLTLKLKADIIWGGSKLRKWKIFFNLFFLHETTFWWFTICQVKPYLANKSHIKNNRQVGKKRLLFHSQNLLKFDSWNSFVIFKAHKTFEELFNIQPVFWTRGGWVFKDYRNWFSTWEERLTKPFILI